MLQASRPNNDLRRAKRFPVRPECGRRSEGLRRSGTMKPLPKWGMMLITAVNLALYIALAVWGWGGWSAFMAHPARAGAVVAIVAALDRGDIHERQHLQRPPRGHREPLDLPALPGPRVPPGVAAGVHRPSRDRDDRRRRGALLRSGAVRRRVRPADRARVRAGAPVQRPGSDPGRPRARDRRPLPGDPPSQLPRPAARASSAGPWSSAARSASWSRSC